MAIEYHFDLYPSADPRDGSRLYRYTADGELQQADYRDVIGVGSGRMALRAGSAAADNLDPAGEQYVRVVRDDGSTELVVGGWWTNEIKYAAAVRQETRLLEVGGAGAMAYLARSVMAPHTYIHAVITGQDPFDRIWRLWNQADAAGGDFLGAVLWRVIYEAQHFRSGSSTYTHKHEDGEIYTDNHDDDRRRSAIPDLVMGFDQFEDSDGNAWTMPSGNFTASVGENVLQVVRRLMEAGLYVEMDPDTFELRAWEGNDHRRDRTGGAWGAAVVRLQAPTDGTIATGNIKSDSERLISSHIRRTTIWTGGGGDVYGFADTASGTPWEGYSPSDVESVTALDNLADTQMAARSEAGDVLTARLKLGNASGSGRYMPWEHVKLDDLITVHTGTGDWDYNEAEYPVSALRIHLREGGDWDAWVDLGASYEAMAQRQFEIAAAGAHTHPPNPRLCVPANAAAPLVPIGLVGAGCSNSGSNFASDHPAYSGNQEERVEITAAQAIPAGHSLIAVVSDVDEGHGSYPHTVYDEEGNTWTLDGTGPAAGTPDWRAHIYRCNVTNPIQAGDYIRFAFNIGSSLSPAVETGGRCLEVYEFSAPLSSPSAASTASGFNSTPTIASTPTGVLTVLALGGFEDGTITGDADWESMGAFVKVTGTGNASNGLLGEFMLPGDGSAWTGSIDQSRDWSLVSVSYDADIGSGSVNDGHRDLVGASTRAARCDHRHDVHRDTAPTADDDWATAGYKLGTIWAQLDDLATPTEIVAVWMLIDDATGAAVWASWPGGITESEVLTLIDTAEPSRRWEAVTDGEDIFVWDGDDLVHEWKDY